MKNRKRFIIIASIVALALIVTIAKMAMAGKDSVKELEILKAAPKDLVQSITVTGNIDANNSENIMLSTAQKITAVLVSEGQQVKAGDLLAKVDTKDYQYQLEKARNSYDVTKLNLDMAKMNLNNLLNVKSESSKKSAEEAVQQAQINLDNIQRNLTEAEKNKSHSQELFNSGAISSQDYDAAVKAVADLQNQVKLAQIQLDNAKRNLTDFNVDNKSKIDQQQIQVQQLTKQLESAKADIDNMADKLNNGEIKASIDGKVVKLQLKPNQYPTQGNNVVSVYDLSKYLVKVAVSQYDAVQISTGQKSLIKIKGLDKSYEGTVVSIGEAAEVSISGTNKESKVEIQVAINNPDDRIRVGYEADVEIILVEDKGTIAINFEALQEDKDGNKFIYVVENGKAVKRIVKTGTETDFDIQVTEGLKQNESYIKNPPAALKEGDTVKAAGGK
jgi:HlyD family secretion protein